MCFFNLVFQVCVMYNVCKYDTPRCNEIGLYYDLETTPDPYYLCNNTLNTEQSNECPQVGQGVKIGPMAGNRDFTELEITYICVMQVILI